MLDSEQAKVSLARIYYPVRVLGPGSRVGIWLNGCDRMCPGCISPELKAYDSAKEVSVDDIMKMIGRITGNMDGFTISGGEPFCRPKALRVLVGELSHINDDILIYSGYTLEELIALDRREIREVLGICAALIDGPYLREENDGKGLRGSANQRCHIFRYPERYAGIEDLARKQQTVFYGNSVLTIGIPPDNVTPT